MKYNAYAVIGANYGDEGKGRMVDWLTRKYKFPIVVRFNGGAQAGHTVELEDGTRHVFSHFGSGTFAGCRTFLSKYFVVNPYIFQREYSEFDAETRREMPVVCDPEAMITTPFDVMINQALERSRGKERHGSVGIGFGATIERNELGVTFTMQDLSKIILDRSSKAMLERRLAAIEIYALDYAERNGIELPKYEFEAVLNRYYDECRFLFSRTDQRTFKGMLTETGLPGDDNVVIFEGAQGLLLDQNAPGFPHVTRSNTGLKNVKDMILDAGDELFESLKVIYVSRAYITRHGAGPLKDEVYSAGSMGIDMVDHTNKPGEFQGSLRFAPLDVNELIDRCTRDYSQNAYAVDNIEVQFAFTCLDQIMEKGSIRTPSPDLKEQMELNSETLESILYWGNYFSMGQTEEDVLTNRDFEKAKYLMRLAKGV